MPMTMMVPVAVCIVVSFSRVARPHTHLSRICLGTRPMHRDLRHVTNALSQSLGATRPTAQGGRHSFLEPTTTNQPVIKSSSVPFGRQHSALLTSTLASSSAACRVQARVQNELH